MAEPYVMVQVFVSHCTNPDIPILLRMPLSTATAGTLTSAALLKLAQSKLCDTLPHNYVGGYDVYPSHGDGRCNRTNGAIPSKEKLAGCSDLSFPYMVTLHARREELTEARQDEPLAEHILAAYGLPASSAPRPLPANVKEIRAELMRYAGLTESDVTRYGPRGELVTSSSQKLKVQQAMILRRREDVLVKNLREQAKVESDAMAHAAAHDEALQSQKRMEAEKKAMASALEKADPLYGARGRLENDVTRLRHKLESDLSRGHAMVSTATKKLSVPISQHEMQSKTPPRTSAVSTRPRSEVLAKVVAALEVSILQEYVDQQAAFKRDRDLRAKKALAAHEAKCHQIIVPAPPAPPVEKKQIVKAVVIAPSAKVIMMPWEDKYEAWKANRAQSLEPVYNRAELHVLQKK